MFWLRLYLLAGLVAHKLLWETMKTRGPEKPTEATTVEAPIARLGKVAKMVILVGITVQILLPQSWFSALEISEDPSRLRVIGVAIYTLGLLVAILARLQLGSNWSDIEAANVKAEQQVVSGGVYRFIRHPIYVGDLLLLLGLELALNSWLFLGVAMLTPIVLRQAIREEQMLRQSLPGYSEYCSRSKRFIPFLV